MLMIELLFRMLLTRAVRPDQLIIAAKSFVESVFGSEFVQKADALLNFEQIINEEIQGLTPILLCSVPGHDASNRVEELATNLNKNLTSIAIGMIKILFLSFDEFIKLFFYRFC
jgi:dynein heavy chain 1